MRLPGVRSVSDAFENEELRGLAGHLNQFVSRVSDAMDNNLTVDDNLAAMVFTRTFYVADDSSDHNPYPFSCTWRFPQIPPKGCIIVRADSTDGMESIYSALQPRWEYSDGRVVILGVRGSLTPNKTYEITFYAFG